MLIDIIKYNLYDTGIKNKKINGMKSLKRFS